MSLREHLLEQWREREKLEQTTGTEEQQRRNLLLGQGGAYSIPDLRARAAILELLASSVDLMHDDLGLLIRELLVSAPD